MHFKYKTWVLHFARLLTFNWSCFHFHTFKQWGYCIFYFNAQILVYLPNTMTVIYQNTALKLHNLGTSFHSFVDVF